MSACEHLWAIGGSRAGASMLPSPTDIKTKNGIYNTCGPLKISDISLGHWGRLGGIPSIFEVFLSVLLYSTFLFKIMWNIIATETHGQSNRPDIINHSTKLSNLAVLVRRRFHNTYLI